MVVVGDGALRAELEAQCRLDALDQVRFVGPQYGEALRQWYGWADAFVLSSDREGMPVALLEAMAAGLAVVSTDVSDLATQVADAGIVVPAEDDALAAAISRLAHDRSLLERLRVASRQRGTELGWGPLVEQLTRIYSGLAA
jgi:glycosyltransferase involved in cell wall biosynthesis